MIGFAAEVLVKSLQYMSSNDILKGKVHYDAIPVAWLQEIFFHTGNTDETSLSKKLTSLKEWVVVQLEVDDWQIDSKTRDEREGISIFDLIHCLTFKMLVSRQERVVYRYKHLKEWHFLNSKIGTELLSACYYARKDFKAAFQRKNFVNTEVIYHDNQILNAVLDKGLSENHFHLRASAPYFNLSWLSLMNSVTMAHIAHRLDQISEHPRSPKVRYRHSYQEDTFALLHLKAAVIRVYLYAILSGKALELGEYYAPVEWLFKHVLDTEPFIMGILGGLTVDKSKFHERYLTEYLENQSANILENIKSLCRGFYWLFWECYPYIPMELFSNGDKLFSQENRNKIVKYIEHEYQPLSLSRCEWLFQKRHADKYRIEWDRQGNMAVKRILSDQYELQKSRSDIQYAIDAFHINSSNKEKDYILDSVEWEGDDWERGVMTGEQWLFYEMERRKIRDKKRKGREDGIYDLFFAYLVIKESFRSELLQNNEKPGFDNFRIYQSRKDWFTTAFSEGELAQIAVRSTFKKQHLKSLELRVMPQNNAIDNILRVKAYDEAIRLISTWKGSKKTKKNYYYVFHFRKMKDTIEQSRVLCCRHENFRAKLKRQSEGIMSMRELNPEVGSRLKGIDACSSEDGCRPEVFAVAFRELKSHTVYRSDIYQKLSQLRISYHVGEENQDVLDGLRAIDEAVYFLNMESGDRLGHATMLGIDTEKWYAQKDYMISIRQHDYLDNVVWLYNRMVRFHMPNQNNLLEYLESEFQKYFNRIYEMHMSTYYNGEILKKKDGHMKHDLDFNIHNYYYAWELRGDAPELYIDGFYKKKYVQSNLWGGQLVNKLVNAERRRIPEAAILYHTYHYNDGVRIEGDRPVTIKIPPHMVRGITELQKKMQNQIVKKGIAIETNPSSNLMIGGLPGYEAHPIISFYNKGLVCDQDKLINCPQINVSINTDDQGVFTTSLYSEYTLMAGALEGMKDKNGENIYKKDMIYDWINNIRKMGNKQAFSRNVME